MPKVIVFIIMLLLLSFICVIVFIIVLKFRSHPTEGIKGIKGAQWFFPSIFWISFHLLQELNMVKPVSASNTTSCCNFSSKKDMP